MTTDFIRLMFHMREELAAYERLAWFLYGCFERERRLDLEAAMASSPFVIMASMSATQPFFFLPTATMSPSVPLE